MKLNKLEQINLINDFKHWCALPNTDFMINKVLTLKIYCSKYFINTYLLPSEIKKLDQLVDDYLLKNKEN